ncbi:hypothetical protein V502_07329 [Pseudogymnoascus sp. VKM F-4520 (FW-2644)]|nr:hypothetical protein V502_07329 [Pseudogymnoascus sp. VKM F-4520 (FW-2644)]
MQHRFLFLAAAALLAVVECAPLSDGTAMANPTVTIAPGVVIGTTKVIASATAATTTVYNYLGIPFAVPPTATRRFAPPEKPTAWTSPLEAKSLPPACMQQFIYPKSTSDFLQKTFNNPGSPPPGESEDCLYLNVYAPVAASLSNKKAVLFWIFGGNLHFGTGSLLQYDGSSFAGFQDVVVVTFNYRTNVFGFSGSPEIPKGQQNSGFLDQRMALQWVQDNIAQFGGDPTRVTIFGESAGGVSVKQLLAQPPSPLPFHAAIMESEQAVLPGTALASYNALLRKYNCYDETSPIACLQKVSATTLKALIMENDYFFNPVNDHVTFTSDVRPNLQSRSFAKVPFFMGTNADEGRVFAAAAGFDNSSATIQQVASIFLPGLPLLQKALVAFYTPFFDDVFLFASTVLTDLGFLCTTSSLSTYAAARGYTVWRYYYNAAFPNLSTFPNAGAYHTSEIPQVFGTYPLKNQLGSATPDQEGLSKYMQTTWANFAKNPSAGPGWPAIGSTSGNTLAELGGASNPIGKLMISVSNKAAGGRPTPPKKPTTGSCQVNSTANTGPGAAPQEEPHTANYPHTSSGGESFPAASVGYTLENTESENTSPEEPFTGNHNTEPLADTPPSANPERISSAPVGNTPETTEPRATSPEEPFTERLDNETLGDTPPSVNPECISVAHESNGECPSSTKYESRDMKGVTGKESGQDASLTTKDRVGAGVTGFAVGAGAGVGLGLINTSQGLPAEDHHSNAESIASQGSISEPASIAPGTSLSYASSEFDDSIQTNEEGIATHFNDRLKSSDEGHSDRDGDDTDEERHASFSETQDMGNHHSTGDNEHHRRDDEQQVNLYVSQSNDEDTGTDDGQEMGHNEDKAGDEDPVSDEEHQTSDEGAVVNDVDPASDVGQESNKNQGSDMNQDSDRDQGSQESEMDQECDKDQESDVNEESDVDQGSGEGQTSDED